MRGENAGESCKRSDAKFPGGAQDRHRAQKDIEHRFLQVGRQRYFAFSIGLCPLLQIRRQQFHGSRVKRKQLMQFYIEREPSGRGGTPALTIRKLGTE